MRVFCRGLLFSLVLAISLIGFIGSWHAIAYTSASADRVVKFSKSKIGRIEAISLKDLPSEALTTLKLIRKGGRFPYRKDGSIFHNRERLLPIRPKGYYREYTVKTPGRKDRGARRIVTGSRGEFYYTADHYRSFKLIKE